MSEIGLPTRAVEIAPADFLELQKDVWSDRFVPVRLEIDGMSCNGELRIRGGHTRNYPKKSYEIRYGANKTLHWNAEFDDPSLIRNALSFHFFNRIGVTAPETGHIWLIWNGQHHGVYLEIEAVDAIFFRSRRIEADSIIYAVNDRANFSLYEPESGLPKKSLFTGYRLMEGDAQNRKKLTRFVRRINRPVGRTLRAYLGKRLDIGQYLKWLAGAVLTGNYDGFDQNYALYEHRASGKYRIIPWDYEGTWGRNCYGRLCDSDLVPIKGHNVLTRKLLSYKSVRQAYRRLLGELLDNPFTVEALTPAIADLYERLTPAIRDDFTRKWPLETFLQEPQVFHAYIEERRAIILDELRKWSD